MVQCGGSNVMLPALASANFVGRCGQMIFPFVDPLENANDESSKVVVHFPCHGCLQIIVWMCVFLLFRGVTQLNSSNPIGSASKTARFGASVFVKELIKDSI